MLPAIRDRSLLLAWSTWSAFPKWFLLEMPVGILRKTMRYMEVLAESCSFLFLLRTLFSPWKGISDEYPDRGFNLSVILQVWALNMTARMIGAVIRLTVVLFGLAMEAVVLIGGLALLVLWLTFPLLVVAWELRLIPVSLPF